MLKQRKRLKVRHGSRKQESRSPRNFHTLNGRAHVLFAGGGCRELSNLKYAARKALTSQRSMPGMHPIEPECVPCLESEKLGSALSGKGVPALHSVIATGLSSRHRLEFATLEHCRFAGLRPAALTILGAPKSLQNGL